MKILALTAASFVSTGAVVGYAFYRNQQFYPAMVYLVKSNPSMAVLYAQAFVFVMLLAKILRKVFFGQLRAAETEHLMERSWYAVTETCLAFTVFREDFSFWFVAMFTLLLFLKGFHWLTEDRIDYMERSPVITWLFHVRATTLLLLLGTIDSLFIHHAYHVITTQGVSVQIVFGFEYAILLTLAVNAMAKYVLHTIDLQSENPWENKAVYMLYLDFFLGFVRVILYTAFMVIMIKVHTFPLFSIRPMYMTIRAFRKSLSDVRLSRRAIANMNTLYPDATAEELAQSDVCIICREEMAGEGCKKLPCTHIFHASCLRSWFQRQQTCPTCRMDILSPPVAAQAAADAVRVRQDRLQQQARQDRREQQSQPPAAPRQQPAAPPAPAGPMPQPPFGLWQLHQPPFFPPGMPAANAVPRPENIEQQGQLATGGQQQQQQDQPAAILTDGTTATTEPRAAASVEEVASATNEQPPQMPGQFSMPGMAAAMPPFMPPPFMFSPPMFGFPPMPGGFPPFPNLNVPLGSLSDEQLRELEGRERANVEARVALLRNVHSLLDTAITQLHQYSQAAAVNTGLSPPVPPSFTRASADEEQAVYVSASVEETSETDVGREYVSTDTHVLGDQDLRQRRLSRFDSSPATVERQTSSIPDETREDDESG